MSDKGSNVAIFDFLRSKENSTTPNNPASQLSAAELLHQLASTRSYDLDSSILNGWNPNKFIERKRYDGIDEMLDDENIFGILEMKKYLILSTGYRFKIKGNEDGSKQELLDFTENNFNVKYRGLLSGDMHQMLSAFEYGFSLSEMLYEKIDSKIYLTRIKTVPPHSIDFATDEMGNLSEVFQRQTTDSHKILPINKMLLYVHNRRFDNPYGVSDCQRCFRAWASKKMAIKFWGIYMQRFSSPFPVAKVDAQFGDAKVDEMLKILDSIQQTVSLVIPKDADLELLKVGNSSGEYDRAIEKYNQMIARALLIPDLIGYGATVKGGSFALGQKHFELFLNIIQFTRQHLEELINEHAIKQLIDINFGKQDEYPKIEFLPYKDESLKDMLDTFMTAVETGMPVVNNDWNALREKIKFPELDLENMDNIPQPVANPKKAPKTEAEDLPDVDDVDKDRGEAPDDNKSAFTKQESPLEVDEVIKSYRAPDKYEKRIDYLSQAKEIEERVNSSVTRIADRFGDIKEQFKNNISRKNIIQEDKFDEIDKLQLKYLGDIRSMMQNTFKASYKAGRKNGREDIAKIKEDKNFAVKITDINIPPTLAMEKSQQLIDAQTFQAVGKIKDDVLGKSKQIMITGMKDGLGEREIMAQLDGVFDGLIMEPTPKSIAAQRIPKPALINTIIRTNINSFYNMGYKQVGDNNPFIALYEFSSILDPRTTEICWDLDGKKYLKSDPIWNTITPPLHYNAIVSGALVKCRGHEKLIENVEVGDEVLTHSNKYCRVYDTMNKFEDKEYFILELEDGKKLKLTGEHPVLTNRGWLRMDEIKITDDIITVEEVRRKICPQ